MLHCLNCVGVGIESPLNVYNTHTECNIAPLIIAGGLAAAGSVIGGLLGKSGQSSANKANLQIARENNAANQQLSTQQNQWNVDQWNRENAYNSASAQKERLIAAGVNPYFGGVSAGTAQNIQSAQLANQQQSAPMQNTMAPLAQGVSDASQDIFSNIMNAQLAQANVRKANADATTAETQAALNKVGAQRQLGTLPYDIEQAKNLSINSKQSNELLRLQTENQNVTNELQAKYGDKLNIAELENMAANKLKTISERNVNVASIGKIASEIARNYAESNHLNADTATINAIRSYVVNEYQLNNVKTQYENNLLKVNSDWQQKYGADALNQQLDAAKFENSGYNRYVKPLIPGVETIGGAYLGGKLAKGSSKSPKLSVKSASKWNKFYEKLASKHHLDQ